METGITLSHYRPCFEGHFITDCAVRDRSIFHFTTLEDYMLWPKGKWDSEEDPPPGYTELSQHIVTYYRADPMETRWARTSLTGLRLMQTETSLRPEPKNVAVSFNGVVFSMGSGSKGFEAEVPDWRAGGPLRGSVDKLRRIDGWLYFCGGNNSVGKRLGPGEWLSHTQAIPNPDREDLLSNDLLDIDGFDERDIYTVGSDGQVFHFDGLRWQRVAFPTNVDLANVCCAGDGYVYVADKRGTLYRGRGERWERIGKPGLSASLRDLVWYEGRLWGSNEYGLWTLGDAGLERATLPPGMGAYAGNLSTADGVLLMAGRHGAAFLENGEWTVLYSAAEMVKLAREAGASHE